MTRPRRYQQLNDHRPWASARGRWLCVLLGGWATSGARGKERVQVNPSHAIPGTSWRCLERRCAESARADESPHCLNGDLQRRRDLLRRQVLHGSSILLSAYYGRNTPVV